MLGSHSPRAFFMQGNLCEPSSKTWSPRRYSACDLFLHRYPRTVAQLLIIVHTGKHTSYVPSESCRVMWVLILPTFNLQANWRVSPRGATITTRIHTCLRLVEHNKPFGKLSSILHAYRQTQLYYRAPQVSDIKQSHKSCQ